MLKLFTPELPGVRRSRLVNQSPIFYGWIILLAGPPNKAGVDGHPNERVHQRVAEELYVILQ